MLLFLIGCMIAEPSYVGVSDVQRAQAKGETAPLCAGLRMKDEATREAAAEALSKVDSACLCARLVREGRWDAPILSGLAGAKHARVACAGDLLDDAAQPDRVALTTELLKIPAARARLVRAAGDDADLGVRAAALASLRGTTDKDEIAALVARLADTASDPAERAAVASVLAGRTEATDALRAAIDGDADAAVRAAALESWQSLRTADRTAVVCDRLLRDEAPEVRARAAGVLRATRDPEQLACLRTRMVTEEPDARVRAALLAGLRASPAPEAADILCDAIPFWIAGYVGDEAPTEDLDILVAQNIRDPDGSYACAEAAMRASKGASCRGRAHLGAFFRTLGGRGPVPDCDGRRRPAASNEISFD